MSEIRKVRGRPFEKGKSGNERGRPLGAKSFDKAFGRELGRSVVVKENGVPQRLTKREMVIKQLVAKAMAGSPRHIELVLKYDQTAAQMAAETRAAVQHPGDEAAKARLLARLKELAAEADDLAGDETENRKRDDDSGDDKGGLA